MLFKELSRKIYLARKLYLTFLTAAKPPLDLNKEMMDKYRPAMRKFYLRKKAESK